MIYNLFYIMLGCVIFLFLSLMCYIDKYTESQKKLKTVRMLLIMKCKKGKEPLKDKDLEKLRKALK